MSGIIVAAKNAIEDIFQSIGLIVVITIENVVIDICAFIGPRRDFRDESECESALLERRI